MSLPAVPLPAELIDAVQSQRAVLFLGAAASFGAVHPRGEKIPGGDRLRDVLCDRFLGGEFKNKPLATVAEYAVNEANLVSVQRHVREMLQDFQPADFHNLIPRFRWHASAVSQGRRPNRDGNEAGGRWRSLPQTSRLHRPLFGRSDSSNPRDGAVCPILCEPHEAIQPVSGLGKGVSSHILWVLGIRSPHPSNSPRIVRDESEATHVLHCGSVISSGRGEILERQEDGSDLCNLCAVSVFSGRGCVDRVSLLARLLGRRFQHSQNAL